MSQDGARADHQPEVFDNRHDALQRLESLALEHDPLIHGCTIMLHIAGRPKIDIGG